MGQGYPERGSRPSTGSPSSTTVGRESVDPVASWALIVERAGGGLVELDHPPGDLADVRVVLDMLDTDAGQPESASGCVRNEQIGVIAEARLNGVLEEAMGDIDRGAVG